MSQDKNDQNDRNDQNDQNGQSVGGRTAASSGAGAATSASTTPEDRLSALAVERDEMKDRMLRIAAEFENWKKRARKEQTDAVAQARESVLKDVLEVADNLERATGAQTQAGGNGSAAVDGAAVVKGVNLVLRLLQQKLERYEVRPFEAAGQPFDPRVHEAISKVESADVPAGSIATELQKGYRVGERLLRPAMVSVSTGPSPTKTTKTSKPSEG